MIIQWSRVTQVRPLADRIYIIHIITKKQQHVLVFVYTYSILCASLYTSLRIYAIWMNICLYLYHTQDGYIILVTIYIIILVTKMYRIIWAVREEKILSSRSRQMMRLEYRNAGSSLYLLGRICVSVSLEFQWMNYENQLQCRSLRIIREMCVTLTIEMNTKSVIIFIRRFSW